MGASNDSSQLFCGVCLHASMSKVQRSNVLIAPKSLAQQNIIPAHVKVRARGERAVWKFVQCVSALESWCVSVCVCMETQICYVLAHLVL